MLIPHHIEITRRAIATEVSSRALEKIIRANIAQDGLRYQLGHDHFHFDNDQFQESYAYIEEQRAHIGPALERGDAPSAWQAFGRMIHPAQDFYAHTDYIPRWLSRFEAGTPPAPEEVDPVSSEILSHPDLHSGKLYYPLEVLAFVPFLRKFILPHLPTDSHAHMNHDGHETSAHFDYVFHAAVKRTRIEFDKTVNSLSSELRGRFVDR
ncbi:MAG: hypothetical protein C4583_00230 [Anaerolineaceae bacterium]|nr:MAG: hypothetical protein C4583_00230 [Anaerolineaceae bacterium]